MQILETEYGCVQHFKISPASHIYSLILVRSVVCKGRGISILGLGKLSNLHDFKIVTHFRCWNCRADVLFKSLWSLIVFSCL